MGLFDWVTGRRAPSSSTTSSSSAPRPPLGWRVERVEHQGAAALSVESGRGRALCLPLDGVRAVRIVPLTGGEHHVTRRSGGWQVSLQRPDGDLLVGEPLADWRAARELAQRVCEATGLQLDELTQRLFSRVGSYTPATDNNQTL